MTNLYKELVNVLKDYNKTIDDVAYITDGTKGTDGTDLCYSPSKIIEFFKTVDYDNGFGINFINLDLKIVLKNGDFIIRGEYDGSEWFEYMKVPKLDIELVEPCNLDKIVLDNTDIIDYVEYLKDGD